MEICLVRENSFKEATKNCVENRKIKKKKKRGKKKRTSPPNGNENTKRNDAEKMSNLCYRRLSELNGKRDKFYKHRIVTARVSHFWKYF